ncbi:MAG: GNAT family N-acetyltransferase [Oscillospiraceae bacterium]
MIDDRIRSWKKEDRPQLRALWKLAFGDSDEYIDCFFKKFLRKDACVVAEADGKVVSAMYILPGGTFNPYRENRLTAGYTYALATLPEYRGQGIGRAVYRAASDRALETADAAAVLPAERSLYPFYENASGAKPLSYVREARLTRDTLSGTAPCDAVPVPALRYAGMREELLGRMPHVTFPMEFFDLMEVTGMEFFVLANSLAAVETDDGGVCHIRELLAPGEDVLRSVAGISRKCPAGEYIVRTPLFFDGPGESRPYVLAAMNRTLSYPMPNDLWWGFGLE